MFSWISNPLVGFISAPLALLFAGMLLLSTCQNRSLRSENAQLTEQRDQARSNLTSCQQNRRRLESSIETQNREVDRLREEGLRRDRALQDVREDADRLRRSRSIINRPGSTCEDLDALILETVR